jgi:hypothetical protein
MELKMTVIGLMRPFLSLSALQTRNYLKPVSHLFLIRSDHHMIGSQLLSGEYIT